MNEMLLKFGVEVKRKGCAQSHSFQNVVLSVAEQTLLSLFK